MTSAKIKAFCLSCTTRARLFAAGCFELIVVLLFLISNSSLASDELTSPLATPAPRASTNFQDTKRSLERPNNRTETDTTPVYIGRGTLRYKIPRNYIIRMSDWTGKSDNNVVTMRVTFPGFEPLTDKTKDCLMKGPLYRPPGCMPVEFWTGVAKADDELHSPHSEEERFNNLRTLFKSQIPKPGPGGFEMYESGPDNARVETYRKKSATRTLLFICGPIQLRNGKRWAPCNNLYEPLPNSGDISYFLPLDQMKNAEEIDEGLRKLVMSFTLAGNKP